MQWALGQEGARMEPEERPPARALLRAHLPCRAVAPVPLIFYNFIFTLDQLPFLQSIPLTLVSEN